MRYDQIAVEVRAIAASYAHDDRQWVRWLKADPELRRGTSTQAVCLWRREISRDEHVECSRCRRPIAPLNRLFFTDSAPNFCAVRHDDMCSRATIEAGFARHECGKRVAYTYEPHVLHFFMPLEVHFGPLVRRKPLSAVLGACREGKPIYKSFGHFMPVEVFLLEYCIHEPGARQSKGALLAMFHDEFGRRFYHEYLLALDKRLLSFAAGAISNDHYHNVRLRRRRIPMVHVRLRESF